MAVVPAGIMSEPLSRLAAMLADCEAWQSWVEADDATEALGHIRYVEIGADELTTLQPWALIDQGASFNLDTVAGGGFDQMTVGGSLLLRIQDAVAEAVADDPAAAQFTFANHLGAVISGLRALAGGSGRLPELSFELLDLYRPDPKLRVPGQEGDFFSATFEIRWGLGGE